MKFSRFQDFGVRVLRNHYFAVSRNQDFGVLRLLGFRVLTFQKGFKGQKSKFQKFVIARFQDFVVFRNQGFA
jgi:hypothetical protein